MSFYRIALFRISFERTLRKYHLHSSPSAVAIWSKKPPFQIVAGSAIVVRKALSGGPRGQGGGALWLAR
jgi:hypothetical protein